MDGRLKTLHLSVMSKVVSQLAFDLQRIELELRGKGIDRVLVGVFV